MSKSVAVKANAFLFLGMKLFFLSLLFVPCIKANSQDLTGTWEGIHNNHKLVIIQVNDSCFGYTYDTGLGFCKANFAGRYKDSTGKLRGVNTDFIDRTFTHGLSSYLLRYSSEENGEFLRGKAAPRQTLGKVLSLGLGIPVAYKKISTSFDTTVFIAAKLVARPVTAIGITNPSLTSINNRDVFSHEQKNVATLQDKKNTRKSQSFNSIVSTADTLRLLLHDNGEIDNDTVTVFHNGKIIVNQLGLTVIPHETILPINTKDSIHRIELMANNLGTIPPNTAYLTIWAGRDKYELRVSSDYSVNARIDIRYKKKD